MTHEGFHCLERHDSVGAEAIRGSGHASSGEVTDGLFGARVAAPGDGDERRQAKPTSAVAGGGGTA